MFVGSAAKRDPDRIREDDCGTGAGVERQAGLAPQESEVGVDREPGFEAHAFESETALRIGVRRRARFMERYFGSARGSPIAGDDDPAGNPGLGSGSAAGRDQHPRERDADRTSGQGFPSGESAR